MLKQVNSNSIYPICCGVTTEFTKTLGNLFFVRKCNKCGKEYDTCTSCNNWFEVGDIEHGICCMCTTFCNDQKSCLKCNVDVCTILLECSECKRHLQRGMMYTDVLCKRCHFNDLEHKDKYFRGNP